MRIFVMILVVLLGLTACATVPKESVELSTTVGRDIALVHQAHRELALYHFSLIKKKINAFVDEVYAPYQIEKLLQADFTDFKNGDRESLFHALDTAIQSSSVPASTAKAIAAMDVFLSVIRSDVENYRASILAPVLEQENKLISAIDRSYNQIHYANSIVTGHLASVTKVHDAQAKLLERFGMEGLREDTAERLASLSQKVAEYLDEARKMETKIQDVGKKIEEFSATYDHDSDSRTAPARP